MNRHVPFVAQSHPAIATSRQIPNVSQKGLGLLLTVALLLCACSDDDYQYPDLVTELAELTIDSEGLATSVVTDGGNTFDVSYLQVYAAVPDTVVRCYCSYALSDDDVTFYTLTNSNLYCAPPSLQGTTDTLAVDIISAWTTPRYLNMYVGVLTNVNAEHAFAFSLDSLSYHIDQETFDVIWTAHHTLAHASSDDDAYYTQRCYVCFPLFCYSAMDIDSVQLTVNTYDGPRSFTAPVP